MSLNIEALSDSQLAINVQALEQKVISEENNARQKAFEVFMKKNDMSIDSLIEKDIVNSVVRNSNRINDIIWPSFFSSEIKVVKAGNVQDFNIAVSNEASLAITGFARQIYEVEIDGGTGLVIDGSMKMIDYDSFENAIDVAVNIVDSQSTRRFFNKAITIDALGSTRRPYKLHSPHLMLPNSNIEIKVNNASLTKHYLMVFTAYGFRIKIDQLENALSIIKM